jgi:hypothetical protein
MLTSCTFDPSTFPYSYGNATHGILINVNLPNNQPSQQMCLFNNTQCVGKVEKCCSETEMVSDALTFSWLPPLVAFFVAYIAIKLYFGKHFVKKFGVTGAMGWAVLHDSSNKDDTANTGNTEEWKKTKYLKYFVYLAMVCAGLLYMASITALIFEAIIMPKSIQETLSPSDRSAQLAMQSFLTPVEEIFSFLEDTMT